ncbi:MAG: ATP-binding cassette domain-containing protein [Deltaproteobacteria bacterium]|nr:ATP-binding cassette domain-containing protein [Deltaproteobacteria bacterium]
MVAATPQADGATIRHSVEAPHIRVSNLSVHYGPNQVLYDLTFDVPRHGIYGIIGPAGGGKSSLLSCLNRTLELTTGARRTGVVEVGGVPVEKLDANNLRRRVAMVLPLPVGLPMSVYDNVAFAPRMAGIRNRGELDGIVERCLTQAALWDEVKERLPELGTRLSGGQQQRLTLARALSTEPDILCLDEFSIAIDPVTTMRIEAVLTELKQGMTVVMVTNLLAQARRIADRTLFVLSGHLVEEGPTEQLFSEDADPRTRDYVTGKFG